MKTAKISVSYGASPNTSKIKLKANPTEPIDRISLKEKDLPEIKDWKVGEEYTICLKVRMKGTSIEKPWNEDKDGKQEFIRASFDILSAYMPEEKEEAGE